LAPIELCLDEIGSNQVNEGRRQEAEGTLFVTGIYAPLQKLFALKGEVLGKGCFDKKYREVSSNLSVFSRQGY
jgi:hypothetical protein